MRLWLILILAIGALSSSYVALKRDKAERANRNVELVLDCSTLSSMAAGRGVPLGALMTQFREAGLTSVSITEDTLGVLRDAGKVNLFTRTVAEQLYPVVASWPANLDLVIACSSHRLYMQLTRNLKVKWKRVPVSTFAKGRLCLIGLQGAPQLIDRIGLGLNSDHLEAARAARLLVVGRLRNYPSLSEESIRFMIDEVSKVGAKILVFSEDQVLGFKDLIDVTGDALDEKDLTYGAIEFSKQKGDSELGKKLDGRLVRVHSINEMEMAATLPSSAAERFSLAVRDRNVRLCFLRLFDQNKAQAIDDNLGYVRDLAKRIQRRGFVLGRAQPLNPLPAERVWKGLSCLGVAAAGLLLSQALLGVSESLILLCFLGLALFSIAGSFVAPGLTSKVFALASACVFPLLALVWSCVTQPSLKGAPYRAALVGLLKACGTSLLGGLFIVSLLFGRRYLVAVDQFLGVKVAAIIPLALAFLVFSGGLERAEGNSTRERLLLAREHYRRLLDQPLVLKQLLGCLVILVVAAFWISRTGNEPVMSVSPLELKFRAVLESLLYARPRTKEFLLGYPALILAFTLVSQKTTQTFKGSPYLLPLILLGCIGQISLVNTFCHTHTPLVMSLLRSINGIWVGALLGIVIAWVLGFAQGKDG